MDALVCRLFAVTAMLVCYALEIAATGRPRVRGRLRAGVDLRFPAGCLPFGLVEAIWAVVALRRWMVSRRRIA